VARGSDTVPCEGEKSMHVSCMRQVQGHTGWVWGARWFDSEIDTIPMGVDLMNHVGGESKPADAGGISEPLSGGSIVVEFVDCHYI
jgi:hypothetical protein